MVESKTMNHSYQYLKQKVERATPTELIVLLYEGEIKFLNQAKEEARNGDLPKRCENLIKAQDVLRELRNALDMSVTEISPKLKSLYNYMIEKLVQANLEKKDEHIDEVLKLVTELKDVWILVNKEIRKQNNQQAMEGLSITA